MNTFVHSKFFFDEKYMKMCHDTAKSKIKLSTTPGYHYYSHLKSVFNQYYIKYYNGVEVVKDFDRIPPPVPDFSTCDESGK